MCGCELACFSFHKRSYYNVQAVDTAPNYKDISYLCYFAYVLEKDTQSHWIFVSEPKMMVRMKVKVGLYQYRSPSPYILTTLNINYSKVFFYRLMCIFVCLSFFLLFLCVQSVLPVQCSNSRPTVRPTITELLPKIFILFRGGFGRQYCSFEGH